MVVHTQLCRPMRRNTFPVWEASNDCVAWLEGMMHLLGDLEYNLTGRDGEVNRIWDNAWCARAMGERQQLTWRSDKEGFWQKGERVTTSFCHQQEIIQSIFSLLIFHTVRLWLCSVSQNVGHGWMLLYEVISGNNSDDLGSYGEGSIK